MKRKLLFCILSILWYVSSHANDLFTNGAISFYYQEEERGIAYLRGDALYPVDISRLRFYWITEDERIIDLQGKLLKKETKGQNILELAYKAEEVEGKITFVPSFRSENQLYLFLDWNVKQRGSLFLEFIPQHENEYLQKEEDSLEYPDFTISSNQKDFEILISRNSSLEDLKLQTLLARQKKYRGDQVYYLFRNLNPGQEKRIVRIDFYHSPKEPWKSYEETWEEEIGRALLQEEKNQAKSVLLQKNKNYLDLLSARVNIPDRISYGKSRQSYIRKQQMLLMRSLYGLEENKNRILEEINIKKKEIESVNYFYYAFLYAKKTGQSIDQRLIDERLSPQILSIFDGMTEEGRLVTAEDSLACYAMYEQLLGLMATMGEFAEEREFIWESKKKLDTYIKNTFLVSGEWKDRSFSLQGNPKNIEYLFLYPKEQQKQKLMAWFQKYYQKQLGIILYPGEKSLDMCHNLKMVTELYQGGMGKEADTLFENLEKYIKRSQNFVLEQYSLTGNVEDLEISSEAIYYYLKANLEREQYHGNER